MVALDKHRVGFSEPTYNVKFTIQMISLYKTSLSIVNDLSNCCMKNIFCQNIATKTYTETAMQHFGDVHDKAPRISTLRLRTGRYVPY